MGGYFIKLVFKFTNMKHKKRRGFTLIELLIVIAVIGVISTMLVVNWRKNEKQYQLQRTAQEIVQNIRKAQDMALNSYKHEEGLPANYGIYFDKNDENSYIVFGDINSTYTYQGDPPDIEVDDISIEAGIEIYSLSSGNQSLHITFSLPDGFTNIVPFADSATIVIKKTGKTCPSEDCKNIIIRRTGQVTID